MGGVFISPLSLVYFLGSHSFFHSLHLGRWSILNLHFSLSMKLASHSLHVFFPVGPTGVLSGSPGVVPGVLIGGGM